MLLLLLLLLLQDDHAVKHRSTASGPVNRQLYLERRILEILRSELLACKQATDPAP
jgi:hypothetical protein